MEGPGGAGAGERGFAADPLDLPKSQVVREALSLYGEHLGRLTDEEREAKLAAFDRLVPAIPDRPREEVERELDQVRAARRGGGRGRDGQ